MKQKFEVTLPIDLGDGVIHRFGEVVELDEKQAKDFQHAIRRVEEEKK